MATFPLIVASWFAYVSENEDCLLEDVLVAPVRQPLTHVDCLTFIVASV